VGFIQKPLLVKSRPDENTAIEVIMMKAILPTGPSNMRHTNCHTGAEAIQLIIAGTVHIFAFLFFEKVYITKIYCIVCKKVLLASKILLVVNY